MSMNFAREQSLLRQKLQAKASPERAAARSAPFAGAIAFLGADDADVAAAAEALAAAWPQMGRAQMTAFVRTLWSSKVHELRDVGARLLALRGALLEPADLPLLDQLLGDAAEAGVLDRLAAGALGAMAARHKKVWKDLKRMATGAHAGRRRAAVLAAQQPLLADAEAFPRFVELAEALLADADAALHAVVDATLAVAAAVHRDAVVAFASRHGRAIALPKPTPAVPAPAPAATAAVAPAPTKPAVVVPPAKQAAAAPKKPAPKKPVAGKPPAGKQVAGKQTAGKQTAGKPVAGKPAPKKPASKKPDARPTGRPVAARTKAKAR